MKKYYYIFLDCFWLLPLLILVAPFALVIIAAKFIAMGVGFLARVPYGKKGQQTHNPLRPICKLIDFLERVISYPM